jgi:hypothetical protein
VPSPQKQKYERSLRPREEKLEVGPQFRFTAKTGVERVYDQLCHRLTTEFQEKDIISRGLKSTARNQRRLNQTVSPKDLLPSIHHKTHFKAATSIFLKSQLENSLKDKTNYLSRALRDVSPSFGAQSGQIGNNTINETMNREMDNKPNGPIIKHDVKMDRKNQNVSFANNEAMQNGDEDYKMGSKGAGTSVNQGRIHQQL